MQRISALLLTLTVLVAAVAASIEALDASIVHSPLHARHQSAKLERRAYTTAQALRQFKTNANVISLARGLSKHSWEYGTTAEALLEYFNPELSVFSRSAFPRNGVPIISNPQQVQSLAYASTHIETNGNTLANGQGASGDPASLGVSAILLGNAPTTARLYAKSVNRHTTKRTKSKKRKQNKRAVQARSSDFKQAALRQLNTLVANTPRWSNGAISQRADVAELWADAMYMIPPFLAYAGVATNNQTLLREAVRQCGLYRQVLVYQGSGGNGLWQHIIGPQSQTRGLWATGNGWAALGMVRVLATLRNWSPSSQWTQEQSALRSLLFEIFNALPNQQVDGTTRFWKNYIYGNVNDPADTSHQWFGDGAGSAALVAAALRLAVMDPGSASYLLQVTQTPRRALANALAKSGSRAVLSPTVNPYDWFTTRPYTSGSPEGQAFAAMAIAAWRDCVQAGVCSVNQF